MLAADSGLTQVPFDKHSESWPVPPGSLQMYEGSSTQPGCWCPLGITSTPGVLTCPIASICQEEAGW